MVIRSFGLRCMRVNNQYLRFRNTTVGRQRELLRLYIRNVGNAVGPEGKYGEPSPSLPSNSENKAVVLRLGLAARNGDLVKCIHPKSATVLSLPNTPLYNIIYTTA